jgi:RND family efflux transporter MFP subunit
MRLHYFRKALFIYFLLGLITTAFGQSVLVELQAIEKKQISQKLPVSGQIIPDDNDITALTFPNNVQIEQIFVKNGQTVSAGKALLLFRNNQNNTAAYQQAQTNMNTAYAQYTHQQQLYAQQSTTAAALMNAKQIYNSAKIAFQLQQQQAISRSQQNLLAPFHAVIFNILVAQGQQVFKQTPILQIMHPGKFKVRLSTDPQFYNQIVNGTGVVVYSTSNAPVTGYIERMNAGGNATPVINAIFDTTVLANLLPGNNLQGNIKIKTNRCSAVLLAAVHHDQQGDYIFQAQHNVAKRVNVQTGLSDEEMICITGDFSLNQPVIFASNLPLHDGVQVRAHGHVLSKSNLK